MSTQTWITREGHLERQVAAVQAPPPGLHTSLLLILTVSQDHIEREECEVKEGGTVKEKVLTERCRG